MNSASEVTNTQKTPGSILVVEDNVVNCKVLLTLLKRFGLDASVASNGAEAVKAAKDDFYSLILMDCHMPEMDGFEATRVLRKMEAAAGTYTPIIAVTALVMPGDRERCLSAGMDDYISKPIDISVLESKLNYWMRPEVVYRSQTLARAFSMVDAGAESRNLRDLLEYYGDERWHQIVSEFIVDVEAKLFELEESAQDRRSQEVVSLSQQLQQSCVFVGAKQMAKACVYIQECVEQNLWNDVDDTLRLLMRSLQGFKDLSVSVARAHERFSGRSRIIDPGQSTPHLPS